METLIFWIGLAAFLAGSYFDYRSSSRQIAYGTYESNKLNADKYGVFSASKFWMWRGIFAAVFIVFYFILQSGFLAIAFFVGALLSYLAAKGNLGKQKKSRAQQILALRGIRNAQIYPYDFSKVWEAIYNSVNGLVSRVRNGRGRYEDFAWWYVDGLDDNNPQNGNIIAEKVLPHVWELSQKPESDWFKDTTQRKVN